MSCFTGVFVPSLKRKNRRNFIIYNYNIKNKNNRQQPYFVGCCLLSCVAFYVFLLCRGGVPDAPDGHKSYCTNHAARKRTTYLFKHFRSGANHTPTTLQCLSTWFSTSQPVSVTMTRSSTRTPNLPGRYTPGSMEKIMPGFTVSVLAALTSPFS